MGWRRTLVVWCGALAPAVTLSQSLPAGQPPLQVLHWWTSASERKAVDVLARRLAQEGIAWQDAAVPGGAGMGAGKVLRSRVLAGDAPDVTQMIGATISEVAAMGLLLEVDGVARSAAWAEVLFKPVHDLVRFRGHTVAAPLGLHRVNVLWINLRLFRSLGLKPPSTWSEFEKAAQSVRDAGVVPLSQSSEPWQVATLFESLVLAEGGAAFHRALFQEQSSAAISDVRLVSALTRLREMKRFMGAGPVAESSWTEGLARLQKGQAAMMVMGDWAKGELMQSGWQPGVDFACLPVATNRSAHLYSVDTLTLFAKDYAKVSSQERLARLAVSAAVQDEYNALKGSVSVRRDADLAGMDVCAKASWRDFARGEAHRAPSLVHRMATDESTKETLLAELHRYFVDDRIAPTDVQKRWSTLSRWRPTPSAP